MLSLQHNNSFSSKSIYKGIKAFPRVVQTKHITPRQLTKIDAIAIMKPTRLQSRRSCLPGAMILPAYIHACIQIQLRNIYTGGSTFFVRALTAIQMSPRASAAYTVAGRRASCISTPSFCLKKLQEPGQRYIPVTSSRVYEGSDVGIIYVFDSPSAYTEAYTYACAQ